MLERRHPEANVAGTHCDGDHQRAMPIRYAMTEPGITEWGPRGSCFLFLCCCDALIVVAVVESSRTDSDDNVDDVASSSSLDVVEIKLKQTVVVALSSRTVISLCRRRCRR